ncbi:MULTISPECIES: LysR family transcriptional regulator [Rhizobium]|uniref:LysR family transcriptional regulator n=2 Tax=Rhizobium leguminosarum TaxID=384 RepID=A0A4Q8XWH0_RHILE|nr:MULTISPECIES: LysR family transcriptional regulator [Rhizobium]KPN25940.1 LysR family transcriptional regulator [Rhizobium brockwellii]QJX09894.1 LysR family transcriptional regulator [Rhizobium brockwellii]TAV62012.1 LysR family transcriptional regulator [Rhizobium leguminosarum]TAV64496.1 LysR family transcriptional regulator [Rhizobium leguminosarum]TAW13783.1 LysR family transcriptional regulator [Rhizobium leguminosarum]
MRFKGLDLNLLVALDALMTERKLTAAARSINLSQPAMSAAIGRLRAYFNDELFVMQQRRLVPTPRAEALAPAVREALLQIQLSVIAWDPLVPAESDRRFRIVLSDFMTLVFFEKVIKRVAREAPGVSFELLHMIDYPDERLHGGDVDFLILPKQFMSAPHPSAKLFGEKLVCVGCPNNQQLHGKLSLERFMSLGHVATMFGRTLKPSVEQWLLLEHGFKRRIEIVVQGFNAIPILLQGTNRISTLPLRLVRHFEPTIPLQIVDHPLPPLSFTEAIQWPLLHNSDPGNIWMRNIILEEASRIEASVEGDFQKARAM